MSSNSGNTFSELLDANREQLESLYASVNIESPRGDPHGKGAEVKVVRLTEETRDHLDDPIQWLEQHYGEKWRHEIRDRRVEGDEILVLVRLELPAFGIRKSQFGRAPLMRRSNNMPALADDGEMSVEREACEAAVRGALTRCIELL